MTLYHPRPERWLTWRFTLRTGFVLLTVLCVWLGLIVDRAGRQRRAAAAIWAVEGLVSYDIEPEPDRAYYLDRFNQPPPPTATAYYAVGTATFGPPTWTQQFQNWLGTDYFVSITAVSVDGRTVNDELVAHLKNLPKLKTLFVHHAQDGDPVLDQLGSALPRVEIVH